MAPPGLPVLRRLVHGACREEGGRSGDAPSGILEREAPRPEHHRAAANNGAGLQRVKLQACLLATWTPKTAEAATPVMPSRHVTVAPTPHVRPTLRISCEAVPPSIPPAGAQGGTSARSTGAALSFVSFIDEMDSSNDSVGIDVPESLLCRQGGAHPCRTILL